MKNCYLLLTILALLFATSLNAKVWTVSNVHSAADFSNLQSAFNGASGGDTIYIEGSAVSHGSGNLYKQLVIIGTGYWLNENDTTQAYKLTSKIGGINFLPGSEGSSLHGLSVIGETRIRCDSITLANNNFFVMTSSYGQITAIDFDYNIQKIIIKQNWIYAEHLGSYAAVGISCANGATNCIISHNLIRAVSDGGNNAIIMGNVSNNDFLISNNVIWGDIVSYYSVHKNNILVSGTYNSGNDSEVYNNIGDTTQYPVGNGNQQNVDMSTVFVDYTKYIDNGYILSSGSPAIGAAFGGGDCGIFGTYLGNPYILSGMPAIPAIFDATIGTRGTTVIPVTIKAISHY